MLICLCVYSLKYVEDTKQAPWSRANLNKYNLGLKYLSELQDISVGVVSPLYAVIDRVAGSLAIVSPHFSVPCKAELVFFYQKDTCF